jgi:hypothetical protein
MKTRDTQGNIKRLRTEIEKNRQGQYEKREYEIIQDIAKDIRGSPKNFIPKMLKNKLNQKIKDKKHRKLGLKIN